MPVPEQDKALERVITERAVGQIDVMLGHSALYKRFSDNDSFRKWLANTNFEAT